MRPTEVEKVVLRAEDWFRDWFAMVGRTFPGMGAVVDLQALELALLDAVEEREREVDVEGIDLMGEVVIDLPKAITLVFSELAAKPEFVATLQTFVPLFLLTVPPPIDDPLSLRSARRDAFLAFFALMKEPLERRFSQIENAMQKREEYARRRLPLVETAEFGGGWCEPWLVAFAQEAAEAIRDCLAAELSPEAFESLRDVLLHPSGAPAQEHAARHGISAATLSRAVARFRDLSRERLCGAPSAIASPFQAALHRVFERTA